MNIDTGKIYPTLADAEADGATADQVVTGTKIAIERLKKKLFPKRRRLKMKRSK